MYSPVWDMFGPQVVDELYLKWTHDWVVFRLISGVDGCSPHLQSMVGDISEHPEMGCPRFHTLIENGTVTRIG